VMVHRNSKFPANSVEPSEIIFAGLRLPSPQANKFVGLNVGFSRSQQARGQKMPLTDAKIRTKRPGDSIQKLSDGGGLQIWISPSGGRNWYLAYRLSGQQRMLALGPYPSITLQQARKLRDEAKVLLASGGDPSQQKTAEKANSATSEAKTFAAIGQPAADPVCLS